jgi:hypothetical protein
MTSSGRFWAELSLASESRFPETETVSGRDSVRLERLQRGQSKLLALTSPFGRQVAEAGHSHSVGESPIDGYLDEVGREHRRH